MGALCVVKKGQAGTEEPDGAVGRQAVAFAAGEIEHGRDGGRRCEGDIDEAEPPGLDPGGQRIRGGGERWRALAGDQTGSVIGDEGCAKGQQAQCEGGFAAAGGARDQEGAGPPRDGGGVEDAPLGGKAWEEVLIRPFGRPRGAMGRIGALLPGRHRSDRKADDEAGAQRL